MCVVKDISDTGRPHL